MWGYLGLYPLYSGKSQLSVSIPLLPQFQLTRDTGAVIVITRHGTGSRLRAVTINGRPIAGSIIELSELLGPARVALDFYTAP